MSDFKGMWVRRSNNKWHKIETILYERFGKSAMRRIRVKVALSKCKRCFLLSRPPRNMLAVLLLDISVSKHRPSNVCKICDCPSRQVQGGNNR